jgi:hypothetical protein
MSVDVDALERVIGSLTAELRYLRDQRNAVLTLHRERDDGCCGHCDVEWPCRTASIYVGTESDGAKVTTS